MGSGSPCSCCRRGPAGAQYFGSNKVQYQSFDFQVLRTEHFDVHYYVAEQDAALAAAAMAERWYERLSRALDHTLSERTPIVLYASPPHFRQTTVLPGMLPDGVGGFTDHQKGRVVLPFAPALGETDHVLGHELVHAFQRDILQQAGRSMALPLWFLEGMAEFLTHRRLDAHTAMWIRDAVDENRLPAIRDLQDPRWFPYRFGQALWAFLADAFGEDIAARALASKANGGAIGRLVTVTGVRESQLTARWHEAMKALAVAAADPNPAASALLVGERHGGGRLNVGPALSPDGAHMVFLSERDRYSVDVFLADARTGRIERKLVTAAANARFDSLQFVDSAGAWDNAGKQFAFAALRQGEPILTILSMPGGDVEREQVFPDLDQIFDPSFSPTGTQIAFSGLSGGITDLYVFDLETAALRRLTVDGFADLQPAWSPDGRTLAFTTDRFTSSLEALTFGDYRLAAFDLESGERFASCRRSSARRTSIRSGSGRSTVHRRRRQRQQRVQARHGRRRRPPVDERAERRHRHHRAQPGAIRRSRREPSRLQRLPQRRLRDPHFADFLRRDSTRRRCRLRAKRSLATSLRRRPSADAVVSDRPLSRRPLVEQHRTAVSVGRCAARWGRSSAPACRSPFSDLLEQRQLQTAVQVGTSARDFAVQTAYVNRQSRWTWGMLGGQLPVTFLSARTRLGDSSTIVRDTEELRQIHRQGMMMAAYPFSRVQRIELSGGAHGISFASDLRTQTYTRSNGSLIDERESRGIAPDSVMLFETGAAIVHDSSVAGATAPVLGTRSRFEIAPTFGDLSLVTLTADYRRYMMPVRSLTVAMRMQHIGRYGADASDGRLLPLIWTVRDLVRGYSIRDAIGGRCTSNVCAGR